MQAMRKPMALMCAATAAYSVYTVWDVPRRLAVNPTPETLVARTDPLYQNEVARVEYWRHLMGIDVPVNVIVTSTLSNASTGGTITGSGVLALSQSFFARPKWYEDATGHRYTAGTPEFDLKMSLIMQSEDSKDFTIAHELSHIRFNHSIQKAILEPAIIWAAFDHSYYNLAVLRAWRTPLQRFVGLSTASIVAFAGIALASWICELHADYYAMKVGGASVREGARQRHLQMEEMRKQRVEAAQGSPWRLLKEYINTFRTHPPNSLRMMVLKHVDGL